MWQEARKQEKKIRGMMVDHKKVSVPFKHKIDVFNYLNYITELISDELSFN